ncbi:MAG: hypothetical protein KC635_24925, partial [Myxococcales bacterium]|nr:hypothetical protein [Myxococcales bacterium]
GKFWNLLPASTKAWVGGHAALLAAPVLAANKIGEATGSFIVKHKEDFKAAGKLVLDVAAKTAATSWNNVKKAA